MPPPPPWILNGGSLCLMGQTLPVLVIILGGVKIEPQHAQESEILIKVYSSLSQTISYEDYSVSNLFAQVVMKWTIIL